MSEVPKARRASGQRGPQLVALALLLARVWGPAAAAQGTALPPPPPQAGDKVEQGIALVHEGNALYQQGQYDKALETYRHARTLFEETGKIAGQAFALKGEADALWYLGRYDAALDAYRKARSLFATAHVPGEAGALDGEGSALFRLGRLEEALDAHRRARALYGAAGDQAGEASSWDDEADVLLRRGDNGKALDAHRRARSLYTALDDRLGQAKSWNGEAAVLFLQGENDKALDAYRQARPLSAAIGDRLGQANSWNGEAAVLLRRGENEKALDAYRHARRLAEAAGDRLGQATSWNGEGTVLFRLNELDKALDAYHQAGRLSAAGGDLAGQGHAATGEAEVLRLLGERDKALAAYRAARRLSAAAGSRLGEANALAGEAWVLFQLGRKDDPEQKAALDDLRQARALYDAAGDRLGQANTFAFEADILFWLGKPGPALEGYRQARSLYEAVGAQLALAQAYQGIARVLVDRHDWQGAVDAAREAQERAKSVGATGGQMSAAILLARAEHGAGADAAAERSAEEAIRLHGEWRRLRVADTDRTESDLSIFRAYELLVPLLAGEQGRAADALTRAEEARSRVLFDLLSSGPPRAAGAADADLEAEHRRLVEEGAAVEEKLAGAADPRQRDELLSRRAWLDRELQWNAYRRAAKDRPMVTSQPLDAAAIQALARQTGPILLYYAADEVVGFLILPDGHGPLIERIAFPWHELRKQVKDFAHDLSNPVYKDRVPRQARELWDRLIAPFAGHLPAGGSLVVVPHGPLHELAFDALRDPAGRLAAERWRISVSPSASALAVARGRHRDSLPGDSILAFAAGRGLRLPESEVAGVAGFFQGSPPTFGPAESGVEVYRKVMSARQVFVATRGVHVPDSRTGTYLEILPTQGVHDSRLSAAEIATIPIEAELVTLAACDAAAGEAMFSDERLDLTRAFLIAGAAAVLATRWKVPEGAAISHFITDFYRAYRQGGPGGKGLRKDEALFEARRLSRERGDPAQLWAAWVLVGDPR